VLCAIGGGGGNKKSKLTGEDYQFSWNLSLAETGNFGRITSTLRMTTIFVCKSCATFRVSVEKSGAREAGKQKETMNNSNAEFAAEKNESDPPMAQPADAKAPQLSLEDRVRLTFDQLGYPQLNSIHCVAKGDQMLLTGELNSFYLKQVAQSVVVKIPGVRTVRNEIEVR
jgi:osmotically-inducible protein OsmY